MKQTLIRVARGFFSHDVGRSGAALAYYLLFALFPLLILIGFCLGALQLDLQSMVQRLSHVIPSEVVQLLQAYLEYVSHTESGSLLPFALVFSVWFPMRATKELMDAVRRAYRLQKPDRPLHYRARQLAYSVILILTIVLTLTLSALSGPVVSFCIRAVNAVTRWELSGAMVTLWNLLRPVLLGAVMFAALALLYSWAQDGSPALSRVLPGAVAAVAAWLVVSLLFSVYVDRFANYSLVYGTLAAVVVLMIWLYVTAVILLLGAELNAALDDRGSPKP